jgi:hypothetical protein
MPVNKAKNHYLGKTQPRLNCAQAVIKAFEERFGINEATFKKFASYGGGGAPEGLCGAYCAARHLIEIRSPDKVKEFEDFFLAQAGSLKCTEIRKDKKLSCLGCVEKAAEFTAGLPDMRL